MALYQYPMNLTGVVYMIRNDVDGKCYIGQTFQLKPEKRIMRHFSDSRNKDYRDYNTKISTAIRQYGRTAFSVYHLIECLQSDLDKYERMYIRKYDSYKNGYNSQH